MGEPQRVELSLLGQSITVRTEAQPAYLRSLARYLEERVITLQRSGVQDAGKALLLAALDIVDELFHLRDEQKKTEGTVRERLGALVALLEGATCDVGGPDMAPHTPPTFGAPRGTRGAPLGTDVSRND